MSEASTELETLATGWAEAERELRDDGYGREAHVVAVCREAVAEQLKRQGASRLRVLLRVWADDAAVLKTYGYQSAAECLWRCREALKAALEAEFLRPTAAPLSPTRASGTRRRGSARS